MKAFSKSSLSNLKKVFQKIIRQIPSLSIAGMKKGGGTKFIVLISISKYTECEYCNKIKKCLLFIRRQRNIMLIKNGIKI